MFTWLHIFQKKFQKCIETDILTKITNTNYYQNQNFIFKIS